MLPMISGMGSVRACLLFVVLIYIIPKSIMMSYSCPLDVAGISNCLKYPSLDSSARLISF